MQYEKNYMPKTLLKDNKLPLRSSFPLNIHWSI